VQGIMPPGLPTRPESNTPRVSSERFQRPSTPAGARAANGAAVSDLPPHPPDVRDEEVAEVLAADFPVATLRGYDRTAVDAYVQRASRVIAELQASSSPQAAVRYALEQVSEQTRSILQQAHDTAATMEAQSRKQAADQLDAAARDSAEERADAERYATELRASAERDAVEMRTSAERDAAEMRTSAERDAADLRSAADMRVREAEDEVIEIWQERERLVEDARDVAARLAEVADAAAEREMPPQVELTEGDTRSLPAATVWDDAGDDERHPFDDRPRYDDEPPAPVLRAVPPPPLEAAPEPALAGAPPPGQGPVPEGDTVEFTPPHGDPLDPHVGDDDTTQRDR
jgi:DivIVA domain-containing protein